MTTTTKTVSAPDPARAERQARLDRRVRTEALAVEVAEAVTAAEAARSAAIAAGDLAGALEAEHHRLVAVALAGAVRAAVRALPR